MGVGEGLAEGNDGNTPMHYYSLTVFHGQLDIDPDALSIVAEWLRKQANGTGAWIISIEKGSIAGHLHFQCVCASFITASQTVTSTLNKYMALNNLPYKAVTRALSGKDLHTPHGMIGYCRKDDGQAHFACSHAECITDEHLQRAKHLYVQHGNILKALGRGTLSPRNLMGKVLTFARTRLGDVEPQPSLQGIIVRMLHSGAFIPGAEFLKVSGRSLDIDLSNAMLRLTAAPELATLDDVAKVFFDGGSVGMWVESDTMGVPPTQLELAAAAARDHAQLAAVVDAEGEPPVITAVERMRATNISRIRADELAQRRGKKRKYLDGERPVVEVYVGPTGLGKTRAALAKYPEAYLWDMDNGGNTLWIDDYDGEEVIIIDEMRGEIPFKMVKRLCDWHPLRIQAKGTSKQILARTIVFTSTQDPLSWYEDLEGEWKRRLNDFGYMYSYPGGALVRSPGQWL